ncbi:GM21039 [Drosophila sechellia]|uniref:alpha-glucosidase n=1 Tax=Drosophila sechellia TaxID=7238 RepID=B4HRY3_DROSE|nr:GM21039 [Drosophila sechellia]
MELLSLLTLLLLAIASNEACQVQSSSSETTKDWWQTAQFYQIYPRSFKDSDGDGIGDLNGITSKLEYLKDLGVTAAWLSPIFKSPMVDFDYDISDFFDIQPEYGTLEDFRTLIKKAKELDLKIVLDFVPNHSSNESEWFLKSVKREKGYEDYYVWHDGKINSTTGKREPPTNWLQYFRGSAWEWNEVRQQFYLHQFAVQQPDLNYRNPLVVEQMKRVLRYWLNEGVSGFRSDALPPLFEVVPDGDGQFPDEVVSGATEDTEDRDYLTTTYIENQPETIDMFYGNRSTEGAHLPFKFNLITVMEQKGLSASNVQEVIDLWLKNIPAGRTPNWVLGNHDKRRAASRYGKEHMEGMNMLVMILPGVSVTYQGEEIGMTDGEISWEDTVDPWGCNSNPNIYEQYTRDPERTPFQWTGGTNAGFTNGSTTWLPLAADFILNDKC